jgi:hypothetical protein
VADQIPDSTKSEARELLAKAYADTGDLGAARYIRGGFDLYPDTRIALLAICDALSTRAAPPAMDREAVDDKAVSALIKRLENPPFGTEASERLLMAQAARALSTLSADAIRQGEGEADRGVATSVDDEVTRAFIDGWNARFDHTDFDMALHYWMLSGVTLAPASHASDGGEA